jgi:hypothetical protein
LKGGKKMIIKIECTCGAKGEIETCDEDAFVEECPHCGQAYEVYPSGEVKKIEMNAPYIYVGG